MKKKVLIIILSIFMVFGCFVNNINADVTPKEVGSEFTIDEYFQYRVTAVGTPNTVELFNGKYYRGSTLSIPEVVTDENGAQYTVTSIGSQAFFSNSYITSLTIPNTVTNIGSEAFINVSGLTEISIPASVVTIGTGAFQQCSNVTSITFADQSQLTTLGDRSFYGNKVESITFPSSITSIGEDAFYSCIKLETVTFTGATPPAMGSGAFSLCYEIDYIYVPKESLGLYRLAFGEAYIASFVRKILTDTDVTVESLLPEDFPNNESLLKWQNDNGAIMYLEYSGCLECQKGDVSDWVSLSVSDVMASLKDNGDYEYSDATYKSQDIVTYTFVMDDDELTSIIVEGFDADYSVLNGTYVMQDMPTIGELLAKANNGFPTTLDTAWADYESGCYIYIDNGYLKLYDCKIDTTTNLIATNADALISDDNYFMFTTADGKNGYFYIYNNVLNSIQFYIDEEYYIYYTFRPLGEDDTVTTLKEIFETAGSDFPRTKTDAWTDYCGRYVFIENDELVIYEGDTKLDSISLDRETILYDYLPFKTSTDASFTVYLTYETFDNVEYINYSSYDFNINMNYFPYNEILASFSGHLYSSWGNDNDIYFYLEDGYFGLSNVNDFVQYDYSENSVYDMEYTLNDNKYVITETSYMLGDTITFNLILNDDGLVETIEVTGYTGEYSSFNGEYKLLKTIKDILPEDFPSDDMGDPTNAWKNENGVNAFLAYFGDYLFCFNDDNDNFRLTTFLEPVNYALVNKVSENCYTYELPALLDINADMPEPFDCTFIMTFYVDENDVVERFEVEYEGDSKYNAIDGTYVAPIPQVTVADVLNTVTGGFPTTHDSGWVNEKGKKIYKNNELDCIQIEKLTSLDTVLQKDGQNYICGDNYIFNMTDGVLTSITVHDLTGFGTDINGEFVPYQYDEPSISIPVGYVGDVEFVTNGKYINNIQTRVTVKINSELLDSDKYEVSSGSTHIKLKSDYIKTLQPGTYIIEVKMDGYSPITGELIITGSNPNPGPSPRHVVLDTGVE